MTGIRCWSLALVLLLASGCGGPVLTAVVVRPHLASAPTELVLPPRGEVRSARLIDGDPVWLVRTAEDEVRVLAADVRTERVGRHRAVLVSYDPACECFRGSAPVVWGLDGAITAHTGPDYSQVCSGCAIRIWRGGVDGWTSYWMDRYDFERSGEEVVVGPRWVATEHVRPDTLRRTVLDVPGPELQCPSPLSLTTLAAALQEPEGQIVSFRARLDGRGGVVRLCAPDGGPGGRCPDDAPVVVDDHLTRDGVEMSGVVTARRVSGGFAEVANARCDATPGAGIALNE